MEKTESIYEYNDEERQIADYLERERFRITKTYWIYDIDNETRVGRFEPDARLSERPKIFADANSRLETVLNQYIIEQLGCDSPTAQLPRSSNSGA